MPDYVEHRDGATEIGKLSAEAVVREYKSAAKEIEAMGMELIERVRQCEAMVRDALAVTEEMKETAARYRVEAKRIFLEIEDCSLVTAEVRKTCNALIEKIAMDSTQKAKKGETRAAPGQRVLVANRFSYSASSDEYLRHRRRHSANTATTRLWRAAEIGFALRERSFGDLCKETAR